MGIQTSSGKQPGVPELQKIVKDQQRYIEHVDRKFSQIKFPEQASGSVFGQAQAVPTASVSIGASGALIVSAWTFYNPGPDDAALTIATDPAWNANSFMPTVAGWYAPVIVVDIGWSVANAPDHVRVACGRAAAGYLSAQYQSEIPTLMGDAAAQHAPSIKGCQVALPSGPQYYDGTSQVFSVMVTWPNTNTPTNSNGTGSPTFRVDFSRVG